MLHQLASRARQDLDEIWYHIAVEPGSDAAADRTIDLVTQRFLLLERWPRLGRARNELRRGLRSYPVGSYVIFYRIRRGAVIILRVLHGRRDYSALFHR